ncbi:hypothetical protein [Rosenbergiella collisarenosi]|uniref:hypothetical protein n=1 Tax=Rosenbergiella collisarenosi TaxID=1544695 RepID=UPI001F4E621C|nr:hypothetical protein [Rosenbergiella collisarenosi]
MKPKKTHMVTLVTENGNKRVKVHETVSTWVVGQRESYMKENGKRNGSPTSQRRILLDTLTPIVILPPLFTTA